MADRSLTVLARGALTSPLKRNIHARAPLPTTRLVERNVRIDPARLAAYARICGFPATGPLPLPYPHILGFPLAMRLMADRNFPLPLLGLVHTRIEVTGHHALHPEDTPELTVYAEELIPHRRGTEVTVVTQARLDGELVWESRSGYLARHRTSYDSPRDAGPELPLPAIAEWRLPADLGRRYGAASGDRNPIHLCPLTARLFGFPRAIAHGMWTFARCLAEADMSQVTFVRADFKAPVLLPGTVTYAADGDAFQLRSSERIHLAGRTARP
ncbi:MaoC/PaaZ C-terminal domain-containing protein [Streptomyces sp. NPDC005408]|uniref:MaoC/PaaZ C-terminal domain-containing protein n=1 Tax=Streptomyces sp. NPDC005408 TaxID=3155341 RepID=UPI0033ADD1FF